MDMRLPRITGIEVTRRLVDRYPDIRVVLLSMQEDAIFAMHALRAGAYAFVTKSIVPDKLLEAIEAAAEGERPLIADGVWKGI